MKNRCKKFLSATVCFVYFACAEIYAANGETAKKGAESLKQATTEVTKYFSYACDLFYIVCAIMALIGAFKIYSKWSSGDPDTIKAAAGWIGSLVFAVVVIAMIEAFFGVDSAKNS